MPKHLIIFASGTGTNAENICKVFEHNPNIQVKALFCNNANAGVIDKMKPFGVPVQLFNKSDFVNEASFLELLQSYKPDLIVLAGFLWLIPAYLVNTFPRKIINIHPALLPKFGGKGMYGHHVHKAVIKAREKEHGITIHFVTEKYDEGPPIFQARFDVQDTDTEADLARKISMLEMQYFPEAIRRVLGA